MSDNSSTGKSFKSVLAEAKLPECTVQLCLRGDLVAEHEAAERELEQAQKTPADSLAGTGAGPIAQRIEDLEAQMQDSTYTFRLRALPRPEWRALCAAHPPRRGEDNEILPEDRMLINTATFFDDLIRASLIDPADLSDDDFRQFIDALTDRQFEDLWEAAWGLNRREVDIPFSRAASSLRQGSAAA